MKEIIDNLLKLQTLEFDDSAAADADTQIEKLRAKIPAQILGHYDRLIARGKKGVAAVRNQVCTGCHMHVPLGVVMTLMHGEDVQICESCGRYLYLAPVAEPVEPKEPAKREKAAGSKKRAAQLQTA